MATNDLGNLRIPAQAVAYSLLSMVIALLLYIAQDKSTRIDQLAITVESLRQDNIILRRDLQTDMAQVKLDIAVMKTQANTNAAILNNIDARLQRITP